MQSSFLRKFRRITYSTYYLPEIDGLRFLALFSVVAISHVPNYMNEKFFNGHLTSSPYWRNFITEGTIGVGLFFIISGFILSWPFARWHLLNKEKVSLRNYYLRRVTRLEPPYIILLVLLFIAQVWILHLYSFSWLLPHFLASVIYAHTIIYHGFPIVLPLAWSLEVEVQFYILAPLFCLSFLIPSKLIRRTIWIVAIIVNILLGFGSTSVANIFLAIHFFAAGIILADLYCSGQLLFKNKYAGLAAGMVSLFIYLFLISTTSISAYFIKFACMFVLIHTVLTNAYMKKFFSFGVLAIIGGMCYSVYLVHFALISALGQFIIKTRVDVSNKNYFIPLSIVFVLVILLFSSVYFLCIEKPFMNPEWVRKFGGKLQEAKRGKRTDRIEKD